ncbi:MAG: hypothetical protein IBJ08_14165 [Pseudomonas sp.]|nr:hypothetical protein [Pseudomonas sp.]
MSGHGRNDRLDGGANNDSLSGGGGNDFLDGGLGTNGLAGGAGLRRDVILDVDDKTAGSKAARDGITIEVCGQQQRREVQRQAAATESFAIGAIG